MTHQRRRPGVFDECFESSIPAEFVHTPVPHRDTWDPSAANENPMRLTVGVLLNWEGANGMQQPVEGPACGTAMTPVSAAWTVQVWMRLMLSPARKSFW